VGGARTVAEAEIMANLGADRCTIAIRAKEPEAVRDELGTFGQEVIAQTRDL
jgi:imidazole glycerol phosphate synthase subunit HisF